MSLTYDNLRVRVAEYMGVSFKGTSGTEKPQLPQKAYDLDIVSKIVNDGYERFIGEFNWEFMAPIGEITFVSQTTGTITTGGTGTFTDTARTEAAGTFNGQNIKITRTAGDSFVTKVLSSTSSGAFTFDDGTLVFTTGDTYSISSAVDGENHRYLMPEDFFGSILREMTYGSVAGTPLFRISQVAEDEIRAARAGGTIDNGDPRVVAFRPIEVDSKPRWEAVFWPGPSTLRTVAYRYRRFPVALSVGTQVPITGQQHDQTLIAICLAEAELERFSQVGTREDRYQKQLVLSKSLDKESRPKNLGYFGDRSDDVPLRSPIGNVNEIDGVDIS